MTIELNMACLAEAASIHDGLLNVLGAGVTLFSSPAYPSPLPLALVVQGHTNGAAEATLMCIITRDDDLSKIFSAEISITFGPALPDGPEWVSFSLNVPLATLIPKAGTYTISVAIDEQTPLHLHFLARETQPPQPQDTATEADSNAEELDLRPA